MVVVLFLMGLLPPIPHGAAAQVSHACPLPLGNPLQRSLPLVTPCVREAPLAADHNALGPGRAFLYSALLPGASQWKSGQKRWIAYLALEGISWLTYGRARSSAVDLRNRYEDLAWDVARVFGGTRVDGDFAYYEALEKFEMSGAFDIDPLTVGIQPEMDLATFNGRAWQLATQIFFPGGTDPMPGDPEYDDALEFYRDRAYDERFEWTWSGTTGEWDVYKGAIRSSDDDFRRASLIVGIVMANHLLSGVDGFVTARLRSAAGPGSSAGFRFLHDDRSGRLALVFQLRH